MFLYLAEKLLLAMDPGLYFFVNQGCLTVDNMNDQEEMDVVDVSIATLIIVTHLALFIMHYFTKYFILIVILHVLVARRHVIGRN